MGRASLLFCMDTEAPGAVRIVVLGGGFGGAYAAQSLERSLSRLPAPGAAITVIDRHNYFVFYPLLVEAGTGSLEPRHAVVSIRSFLKKARFRMAEVTGVDTGAQRVTCRLAETHQSESIPYDHLVIALGSVTRMTEMPGLAENAFQLKSLADAVAMRDHAIEMLEVADCTGDEGTRRSLLHFVVVGGNFSGVEVAGELEALLRKAAEQYRTLKPSDIAITLVEHGERLLGMLDEELSAYAAKNLRSRGVDVRLKTGVVAVGPRSAALSTGEELPSRTIIWCAGIAPTPLTGVLPFPRDQRGYIACEPDLRVKGFQNVWAVGDCADNPDPEGKPYPATAQHAVQQARHLAGNIARVLRGQETTACEIHTKGWLAALGCRTGVARVMGVRISGFAAWWLWRTVYLMKTPGWGRRIRVALEWTLELFFKRDYVQLGAHLRVREPTCPPTQSADGGAGSDETRQPERSGSGPTGQRKQPPQRVG